jgi:signal transduction histidine kinase
LQNEETYLMTLGLIQVLIVATGLLYYKRLRKESELQLKQQTLLAKEQSMKKLAEELHDNIAPSLLLTRLQLEHETKQNASSGLQDSIANIDTTLEQIRQMATLLHPSCLSQLSLPEATKSLLCQLRKYRNIKTTLTIESAFCIHEKEKEVSLFRFMQEAIQNLIKHAQATEVNVCFKSDDRFLYIYIKDNGIGFNIKTVQRGSGLYNLQQRAQSLRGQCTLLSRPGHGTHIHLQIPK